MVHRMYKIPMLLFAVLILASCRGQISDKPPIHPQQNMYFQERFNAQEENPFFEDGRAMRMPVEGTVARGQLREDHVLYQGLDETGEFVAENPLPVTSELLYRGQDRYDIYCSVCHGGTGDGQGIIMAGQFGFVPAPTFHQDRLREVPDGEVYSAIANGVRTMPSYATQVRPNDRWAIVAYIRALQQSQYQTEEQMAQYGVDLASLLEEHEAVQSTDSAEEEDSEAGAAEITAERGEQLFTRNGCQACHTIDGTPGGIGPTLQGVYNSERTFDDGTTTVADEEYLYEEITNPSGRILEGYQPFMQPFSHLADDEIYSLVEYIKTLSDN